MKKSSFAFRSCPVLREEIIDAQAAGPILCIVDSSENLELSASEKALIKNIFAGQDFFELDRASDDIDFTKPPVNTAQLLHLATHSMPANAFTDPFFISTSHDSKKHSVWLESVQREAHNLKFKLVMLNGCNTGTSSNWNYFKGFSTNEKVGLSSAFLLNRLSVVVATQWNEPEIVGYTFSALFYRRLATQPDTTRCFVLALIDLFELTKEEAIKLFQEISDAAIREKRCEAVAKSKTNFPFQDVFCLGLFQCHGFLAK